MPSTRILNTLRPSEMSTLRSTMVDQRQKRISRSARMVNGPLLSLRERLPCSSRTHTDPEKFQNTRSVGQFTAFIDVSQHSHIIMLDCAIHLRVARSNDLSLDKHDRFGDLITHHVVIRVNTALGRQSGPSSKRSRPNPFKCRNFPKMECRTLHIRFLQVQTSLCYLWPETPSEMCGGPKAAEGMSDLGMLWWKHPQWTRGFLWVCDESSCTPSVTFTEIATQFLMSRLPNYITGGKINNCFSSSPIHNHHPSQGGSIQMTSSLPPESTLGPVRMPWVPRRVLALHVIRRHHP